MAKDFSAQIEEALKEYGEKVKDTVVKTLPEVAKQASQTIKASSPTRTGTYASGWRQKTTTAFYGVESVVYNAKKPGLPHLLEFGHAKRNGGRVGGDVHIRPVEEWVKSEAVRRLEEALS